MSSLPTVRPMQPAEACVRLYANALNALSHSDYGLEAVLRIAERVPCFAVRAGDLETTCAMLVATMLRPAHADGGIAMILRLPRWMRVLLTVGLIAGIAASVPAVREPMMRALGSALIVEDPFEVVDVIVVSVDADGAGVLEAADLVKRGVAKRVAIFAKPLNRSDQEFARRGLPAEDEATRQIRELASLGVTDVERILLSDAGTDGEALALPHWTAAHGFKSVLVISSPDHSRRLRRVMLRAMRDQPTSVAIRPARYADFDAERWWQTRDGARTAIIEWQKLVLDYVLHPL